MCHKINHSNREDDPILDLLKISRNFFIVVSQGRFPTLLIYVLESTLDTRESG